MLQLSPSMSRISLFHECEADCVGGDLYPSTLILSKCV